jgi:hypothetical protein
MKKYEVKKIQKIKTNDGAMIPIYRDWDININKNHRPKMVYATTLNPGIDKDIILHERRSGYMTCIQGSVRVEILNNNIIEEVILDFDNSENEINLLLIEPNTPVKICNTSKGVSIIINCPDPSWHPDNEDTLKFKKWSDIDVINQ